TCLLACSIRSMMKSLRPNHLLFLQLLIAFSGGFGAEAAAIEAVADRAAPLYMLRGQSAEFWCRHDPGIDIFRGRRPRRGGAGLLQDIGRCSAGKRCHRAGGGAGQNDLRPALLYRSVFGDAPSDILRVFRINRNDPLIQDGTVSILHGNSSVIALTIRDRPGVQALCAFCGQLGRTTNYVTTSKQRVQVVSRPEARLSLNNQQLSGDSQSESELKSGENFVLGCSGVGSGGGRLSVRLEKSGKVSQLCHL
uniref:Zf-CHCC domain-containing protein n=1 Tax=Macrostomum lignano TaxID=282301 RepID=A0A1I8HG48_9PLAT